jgi:PIN domain nuclease of toxin-antitoxin system
MCPENLRRHYHSTAGGAWKKGPSERMLVAHSLQHDLTIVTIDDAVKGYPVKLLDP